MDAKQVEQIVENLSRIEVDRLTPAQALETLRNVRSASEDALEGRFQSALHSGRVATGMALFSCSPAMVEIMGHAGFDFVIIDTEHTPLGTLESFEMQHLIRAAKISGITPIVRVSDNYAPMVQKALDGGAEGIIAPHINTAEDTRRLVRYTAFPPKGVRGACPVIAGNRYFGDWNRYTQFCESEILVIPLIEEVAAVENIEEIAAVEGVDCMWLGPFDLSVSMGITGQMQHPKIAEARHKIVAAAQKHKVAVADVAFDADSARQQVDSGIRALVFAADLWIFNQECRRLAQMVQALGQASAAD